jgi:hypothetical protein
MVRLGSVRLGYVRLGYVRLGWAFNTLRGCGGRLTAGNSTVVNWEGGLCAYRCQYFVVPRG